MLALAILGIGCRAAGPPSCPAGAPIELDLAAWRRALEAVGTAETARGAGYDELLGELELPPLARDESVGSPGEEGPMALLSLEVTPLRRGGGAAADRLLAARFGDAAGAESLRAQLLRPVPGRQRLWCPLGDELSLDRAVDEEPCLERHAGPARELGLVQLVAPDRDAIVARDAGGWCGPGTSRGDRFATSYWGVERGRLVRYVEAVTFEAWYESPAPPVATRRAEIELSDSWPRAIRVTETVECRPAAEPAAGAACEPSESTREYRYAEDRYLTGDPKPTDPAATPSEETPR